MKGDDYLVIQTQKQNIYKLPVVFICSICRVKFWTYDLT
jgi:hypothetical protein